MIRTLFAVRGAAKRVAEAAGAVSQALREGRIEQEPAVTDRMLGAAEEAMRDFESKGIRWRAKTLTDRGPNSQEKRMGADFAGVLSIDVDGFSVKKGFLAQAKCIEPGDSFPRSEYERMSEQCEKMLEMSPDSFVFLYSREEVKVVPAVSVVSSSPRNPHDFYARSLSRFYEEHFESFIGDRSIHAPTPAVLEGLRRRVDARALLYLEARRD